VGQVWEENNERGERGERAIARKQRDKMGGERKRWRAKEGGRGGGRVERE